MVISRKAGMVVRKGKVTPMKGRGKGRGEGGFSGRGKGRGEGGLSGRKEIWLEKILN